MNIEKIYYINLDKRKDRRQFMEKRLSSIDLPYERFSAISPTNEDLTGKYKEFRDRMDDWMESEENSHGKLLGTLGCYLSHYFIHKKALKSSHGNYLILEDDWTINPEAINMLRKSFSQGLVGWDWDIFGSFWSSHRHMVIKHRGTIFNSRFYNGRPCRPLGGTHFMLFNKKSTSKIINFLDCENVFNIDGVFHNDMLNIYHQNMPIENNGSKSDIQCHENDNNECL